MKKESKTLNEKEIIKEVKENAKKDALAETEISEKDAKIIEKAMEEAKQPVSIADDDFKLGEHELDIRNLNDANFKQMAFRMLILNNVYQRQIAQSLIDVMRLIMLILKHQGCTDIVKETENLITELTNQVLEKKENLKA